MFLPLRTELPDGEHAAEAPTANLVLIAITTVVSLGLMHHTGLLTSLALTRGDGRVSQLLSHALLHKNLGHLLGNMVFLFAFGNALNCKLGHARYVGLYVLVAAIAGLGWLVLGDGVGAIGASGAAMGILGATLVVMPFARVTLAVWILPFLLLPVALLFPLGIPFALLGYMAWTLQRSAGDPFLDVLGRLLGFRQLPVPTVWVALVFIALDVWSLGQSDGVAHWAHVAGVAGGIGIALFANAIGAVRGGAASPTLLEWAGALERVRAPRPVMAFNPYRRATAPVDDFEAWRRQQPERRRRRRDRRPSGRLQTARPC